MCFLNLSVCEICLSNDKNTNLSKLRDKNLDDKFIDLIELMIDEDEIRRPDFIQLSARINGEPAKAEI